MQGYVLGDGTTRCFDDDTKEILDDCPLGISLQFDRVHDINAFSQYEYSATLKIPVSTFHESICPRFCNGLNATEFLELSTNNGIPDCEKGTIYDGAADLAFEAVGSTEEKLRCLFHHVNVHSCPAVNKDGDAQFCKPYVGNVEGFATHTPVPKRQGVVGLVPSSTPGSSGSPSEIATVVQSNTFSVIVPADRVHTKYTTIVHYRFGANPSLSVAAGWIHEVNGFAERTQCPQGYVPNPDGTCASCGAAFYASPIASPISAVASGEDAVASGLDVVKTVTLEEAVSSVDSGAVLLSDYSRKNFCAPCSRGQYWGPSAALLQGECEGSGSTESSLPPSALATDVCRNCPAGFFQSAMGRDQCLPCAPGFYVAIVGSSLCHPCPQGTYQSLAGQKNCTRAGSGEYVENEKSTSPTPCPHSSMVTRGEGSISPIDCVCAPATFYDEGVCKPCPPGFSCPGFTKGAGGNAEYIFSS